MGETTLGSQAKPFSVITENNGQATEREDGAINADGSVWGTYLHGIFDNTVWARQLLDQLRHKKGLKSLTEVHQSMAEYKEQQYEKLAKVFKQHVDMQKKFSKLSQILILM